MRKSLQLLLVVAIVGLAFLPSIITAQGEAPSEPLVEGDLPKVDRPLKANEKAGSKTDDEVVARDEEAIKSDGFSTKELKTLREKAQTLQFQAEVNKLMGIIINSLYSSKEVFLREIISNASDALDKIRHISLTDSTQVADDNKFEIRIKADLASKTLTITDTGVGMTREELINNLGTIAKSGTTEFLKNLQDTSNSNLIGQFGVGFYSVYLVADNVTVISKNNKDVQQVWQSDAQNTFSISEDPRGNTLGRGTSIVLHIKNGEEQFLQPEALSKLVKKYSEFINFPIYLWTEKEEDVEVPLTEAEIEEKKKEIEGKKTEGSEEDETQEEEVPTTKTVREKVPQWELMNENKPIWTKSAKQVTTEEYNAFFKVLCKDLADKDPIAHIHFNAEGDVEFKSLLYIPGVSPSNQYDTTGQNIGRNIKLYVKRVFITDDFRDILPKYLAFIRGLVDADDLPLNVSREMLQEHKNLQLIKNRVVRKVLTTLQDLADDEPEKYLEFYKLFSANVKLGVVEDAKNRPKLLKLLRFHSSKSEGKLVSLSEYVDRMREGQKEIFYLSGDSLDSVSSSPLLERLVKKGYEVLFMVDPIDEYALASVEKYEKFQLRNIIKGVIDLGEDKEETKKTETEFNTLTTWLKKELASKVEVVRITNRLLNFPTAIVSALFGMSPQMEKIMKAQAMADPNNKNAMPSKRILEINPKHPLIIELNKRVNKDENDVRAKELSAVLYQTAALSSGYLLEEPNEFAAQIVKMMNANLELDPNAAPEEEPAEEELPVAKKDDGEKKKKKKKKLPPNVKLDNPEYEDFISFGDEEEDTPTPTVTVTPPQEEAAPEEVPEVAATQKDEL